MPLCGICGAPKTELASGRLSCKPCKSEYDKARRAADPDYNRDRCLEYAAGHREISSARARAWHAANKARAKAYKAAKYLANREAERENRRRYYLENSEEIKAKAKLSTWRLDNPDAARALVMRRVARKRLAVCEHGEACVTGPFLAKTYASACFYCGQRASEADHFMPIARGGAHCKENIVPACSPCNGSKWAHDPWEWMSSRMT